MTDGPPSGTPPRCHLIHHVGVFASAFEASRAIYLAGLEPLGIVAGYSTDSVCELWRTGHDTPSLSLERATDLITRGVHLAFTADDRAQVDTFHTAAVAAGATSRHLPRHWPEYGAYCAFVTDPDGNNIEALVKDA